MKQRYIHALLLVLTVVAIIIGISWPRTVQNNKKNTALMAFPKGCVAKNYQWHNEFLILNKDIVLTQIYLIQNLSNDNIWLDHVQKEPSASAGYATRLSSGQWAALHTNKSNFLISCAKDQLGQTIACEKTIQVCAMAVSKHSKLKEHGTFWLSEDKLLVQVLHDIQQRS